MKPASITASGGTQLQFTPSVKWAWAAGLATGTGNTELVADVTVTHEATPPVTAIH